MIHTNFPKLSSTKQQYTLNLSWVIIISHNMSSIASLEENSLEDKNPWNCVI